MIVVMVTGCCPFIAWRDEPRILPVAHPAVAQDVADNGGLTVQADLNPGTVLPFAVINLRVIYLTGSSAFLVLTNSFRE